ncbi:putative fatty acyl-CoA reductase CG5065 [Ctenocephalides felis]|uniref:putative fatty acyl-CoA reductase CG5065 n=1 Tax=Ctenocephalides felis TaxID=7515 RepID=UPI000E6E3D2A|nr:putative fatty acyl-CoA reductase CG5065 [Ctenocephalides felis]
MPHLIQNNITNLVMDNDILNFYENRHVLVTGGTGFLGKSLLEKLLRCCDTLEKVYVLLRRKRGVCAEQRFCKLKENLVFDRIRDKNPDILDKLVLIKGDVTLQNLGLSESDRSLITSKVSLIFHVAATVRFDEGLKDAISLNTLGTKQIMDLAMNIRNLAMVVHVSTAYCYPGHAIVEETVGTPDIQWTHLVDNVKNWSSDMPTSITSRILGRHPNTYTLSKQLAEQVVLSYSHRIPVTIVRPSIVTAARSEPFPGWVDNISGITGIMMEIGRGTISSIFCDENLIVDLVPVDFVADVLICSAWESVNICNKRIEFSPRVYNCTSGSSNPITWRRLGQLTVQCARRNPTRHAVLYPGFSYRLSRIQHRLVETLLHMLPAMVLDTFLRIRGAKPIMTKIARRFKTAAKAGEYFATNQWEFRENNLRSLNSAVSKTQDAPRFLTDISTMDWPAYIEVYMLGIRKYVLRDGLETLPYARRKLHSLHSTA